MHSSIELVFPITLTFGGLMVGRWRLGSPVEEPVVLSERGWFATLPTSTETWETPFWNSQRTELTTARLRNWLSSTSQTNLLNLSLGNPPSQIRVLDATPMLHHSPHVSPEWPPMAGGLGISNQDVVQHTCHEGLGRAWVQPLGITGRMTWDGWVESW
jgi:hypothetical protein